MPSSLVNEPALLDWQRRLDLLADEQPTRRLNDGLHDGLLGDQNRFEARTATLGLLHHLN